MGKLIPLVALVAGCGSPPAVVLTFSDAEADSACLSSEATWFENLERVWVSVEDESAAPVENGCVEAGGVDGWDALESRLHRAGDLLEGVPIGPAYYLWVIGVHGEDCPGDAGPTHPIDFCGYTTETVVLSADDDVSATIARHCSGLMDQDDCRNFAEGRR